MAKNSVAAVDETAEAVTAPAADAPLNERQVALTMHAMFQAQEQVEMSLSPMYQNEFGRTMPVNIQGILIVAPVDGSTFTVPEAFAQVIRERIRHVDDKIMQTSRISNVKENFESSPGALPLIK